MAFHNLAGAGNVAEVKAALAAGVAVDVLGSYVCPLGIGCGQKGRY
jgi:hypothetical protein